MKVECGNILKELMNHPAGWVFSEPVDPVKLHIPDYFSIVSKPMDLGTVKGKLDIYSCADEFFDDVKLTFANAILYNPGWNRVHHLAKQLDSLFCKRWKRFEADRKRKKDSDHTHSTRVQPKKDKSEKEMVKERERIEEEFRAAQKEDLKRRRTIERVALEHTEKSVSINDDNAHLLKELESVCGDSAYDLFYGRVTTSSNCVVVNPLEKLGLYLKEDDYYYFEDEEQDRALLVIEDELEEGEIR
ncbi:hypothetical protein MIMGU_mgv1a024229mg [Erythranthe guttata]|uniref:Bromo domain-containing protein n=1 Tax=Erythranthe guttata TaxID=4155 RepID=A0A022QV73_ERYGU|nr:hypothetical protein MIMGU_mgv1a024229mg [Erythranthe guttata]